MGEPYTISAAEMAESSFGAARMLSSTQGRWTTHSLLASLALNVSLIWQWERSTMPFDCGWFAVVVWWRILSLDIRMAHTSEVN